MTIEDLEKRVAALEARESVLAAVARLMNVDGHSWSARPCPTCTAVTGLLGDDFGCVAFAKRRR